MVQKKQASEYCPCIHERLKYEEEMKAISYLFFYK